MATFGINQNPFGQSNVVAGTAAGGDLTGTYPNPSLVAIGAGGGPIGDATNVAQVTYDTKGRVTALTAVPIAFPAANLTTQDEGVTLSTTVSTLDFVGAGVVASGGGATTTVTVSGAPAGAAGGDLAGFYPNPTLAVIGAGGGPIGDGTNVAQVTFDTKGRVTTVAAVPITFPAATINTQDEGVTLSSTVTTLNFVGGGVTATGGGATTTVTIPGAGGGPPVGFTDTPTAAGTTNLTNTSTSKQFFSGATTQTIVLPVVTTLANGWTFEIVNTSSGGAVTVITSGSVTVTALPRSGGWGFFTCIDTTAGTGTASWKWECGVAQTPALTALAAGSSANATGTGAIAFGSSAAATANNAIALGTATASGASAIAIGVSASASATDSVAIGDQAQATTQNSTACGFLATATGTDTSAFGGGATATGVSSSAFGKNASATVQQGTAIGQAATASGGTGATALGSPATASAQSSLAIGQSSVANVSSGIAIGAGASTNSISNSIVFNAIAGVNSPLDAAHALYLGLNSSSIVPGTLGVTISGAAYVFRKYTSDFASTATAAATTTLTATSAQQQYFTGATTQTVTLPVVTTLANGFHFKIANLSTGAVTVNTSGGNLVAILAAAVAPASTWGFFTCVNTAGGTGTASWSYDQGA